MSARRRSAAGLAARRVLPALFLLILPLVPAGPLQLAPAPAARAQGVPAGGVYTLNQERLFSESRYGRRVREELARRQQALAAENRRLERQLKTEEQKLTDQREGMDPKAFRKLADAFDARVEKIRKDQARKAQDLNRWLEQQRKQFFEAAAGLLPKLALDLGVSVIIDERATFYAVHAADLTALAIARIDSQLGDGLRQPPADGKGATDGAGAGSGPDGNAPPGPGTRP